MTDREFVEVGLMRPGSDPICLFWIGTMGAPKGGRDAALKLFCVSAPVVFALFRCLRDEGLTSWYPSSSSELSSLRTSANNVFSFACDEVLLTAFDSTARNEFVFGEMCGVDAFRNTTPKVS
jgi:hypothetical protein